VTSAAVRAAVAAARVAPVAIAAVGPAAAVGPVAAAGGAAIGARAGPAAPAAPVPASRRRAPLEGAARVEARDSAPTASPSSGRDVAAEDAGVDGGLTAPVGPVPLPMDPVLAAPRR